jgi:hypothetical protein
MLFRSVLGALGGPSRSLPAEDANERVAVDVALLLRRNFSRALCSRVLMLLMPASTRRTTSSTSAFGRVRDTAAVVLRRNCSKCKCKCEPRTALACERWSYLSASATAIRQQWTGDGGEIVMQKVQRKNSHYYNKSKGAYAVKSVKVTPTGQRKSAGVVLLGCPMPVVLPRFGRSSNEMLSLQCIYYSSSSTTIQVIQCTLPRAQLLHASASAVLPTATQTACSNHVSRLPEPLA